jgi:glutaredoxin
MNKKMVMILLAVVVLAGAVFFIFKDKNNTKKEETQKTIDNSRMTFFYGDGCPNCVNVEKFLEENKNIEEKVEFEKKEVFRNKENLKIMKERAVICGISEESLGVPLFWDGNKCFVGDVDIINFLKEKAGIQQ